MKTIIINLLLFALVAVIAFSCQRVPDNFPSTAPNNSTSYPSVKLIGAAYVHIPVGGTFIDPGAIFTSGTNNRPSSSTIYAAKGQVNVDSPGIYAVNYEAANANGYKASATRNVLVLNYSKPSTLAGNFDIEGLYLRMETGLPVNVIRMDSGLYILDNFSGSSLVYPAYMTMPTDSTINIPSQKSLGFRLDCTGETFNRADSSFSFIVQAADFNTSVRHFKRAH